MHSSNDRLYWADLCRVSSIYGVVLIHSCGASFYQFGNITVFAWLQSVALDSLVRCSVPLFVMLSGALIFGGNRDGIKAVEDIQEIPRRTLRIAVPLLVWSIVYLWHLARGGVQVNLASILAVPAMYHLWFAYMIVGIYLLLPILRPIFVALRNSPALQAYFFLAWLIVTSLPVYWPFPLLSLLQQGSLFGYGGYFLLGALIVTRLHVPLSSIFWVCIFILGVVVTVLVTWYQSARAGAPVETGFLYFAPNVVMASVSAFVLFSRMRIGERWAGFLRYLSDHSFIVYFVHVLVLEYVRYSATMAAVSEHLPIGLTILLVSLTTFALSLVVSSLVRLFPGAARVFG